MNKLNKKIEITYARAFFCISIVTLHSFPGLINDPNTSEFSQSLNSFLRIFFLFATPAFIIWYVNSKLDNFYVVLNL